MTLQAQRWVEVVSHLDPSYGGLSAAVPALGQRIAERSGIDVSIAAFTAAGEHFQPDGFDAGHLSYWPAARRPWLSDLIHARPLDKAFKQQVGQADGIHIHGLWEQSTAVAASTAQSLNIPYVLSAHGMLEPWALNSKRWKKRLYSALFERSNVQRAKCLHALSAVEAAQYLEFGATSPIAIIPNGVDIPDTHEPEFFLDSFPHLRGQRVVLFLGRLHPKKGLDLLLEVWCRMSHRYPDAHLVLAGPDCDGTASRLEKVIHEKCPTPTVTFAGMLHDRMKWSALAAAEAFVLPSFSEGFSMSVLEAMGMGLPVIITNACNMPEVSEYDAGWLIDPNANELDSALGTMLGNCVCDNKQIGLRGARLIATQYTWDRVASRMAEVYRWLAGGPEPYTVEIVIPGAL